MPHKPLIIGLTGNIATGKSTILRYLVGKGAHVIDADQLSHRAMAPNGLAYQAIIDAFGAEIIQQDGTINRAALGKIVFTDADALQRLEQIVHPAVFALAQQEITSTSASVIVLEAIKLLEAQRLVKLCNEIWVVTASPATQLRRLQTLRGMEEAEARQRMAAQSSQAEKVKHANRVIDNDSTPAALQAQLEEIWADVQAKYL
ncbi:dephospho-CoA kinase [soil metagenome]